MTEKNINSYVVDCSVAVKWFNQENEPDSDKAWMLLEYAQRQEINLLSPDILFYELLNALYKGKGYSQKELVDVLQTLILLKTDKLPLYIASPTGALLEEAIMIATKFDLTIYDAAYVALAHLEHCPLITANPKCQAKVKPPYPPVHLLENISRLLLL